MGQPFHDRNVSIEPGVLARLKKLDPNLLLTFSQYALSIVTGQPMDYAGTKDPIVDPAWYLWQRQPDGGWINVAITSAEQGFGHREISNIEKWSWLKELKPEHIVALWETGAFNREQTKRQQIADRREQFRRANKKRIGDLVFEQKSGLRQAKPISFPGQTSRNTVGTMVLEDAKRDGWEMPDDSDPGL